MEIAGFVENCAVNCTILEPERRYQDHNVIISKWLRAGMGHVLQEKPGT